MRSDTAGITGNSDLSLNCYLENPIAARPRALWYHKYQFLVSKAKNKENKGKAHTHTRLMRLIHARKGKIDVLIPHFDTNSEKEKESWRKQ